MPRRNKLHYGKLGEDFAVKLLIRNGYEIIHRNFKIKTGEIDIIAKDKDTIVFVEVKTRWSKKFGLPEEAVNSRKLNKIRKVGTQYLLTHSPLVKKARIDVIAIEVENGQVKSSRLIKTSW